MKPVSQDRHRSPLRAWWERSSSEPVTQPAQRRSCKAASSCEEAVIMWCQGYGGTDWDGDGVPCENVCGSVSQVDAIRGGIGC